MAAIYPSVGMIPRMAFAIGLLLLPMGMTLWFRTRAVVRSASNSGLNRWYDYRRNQRALNLLIVAAWCALWDYNGNSLPVSVMFTSRLAFLTSPSRQVLLYWLLPVAFLLASEIIAYAASRKIRDLNWSRSQVLRQGLWEVFRYTLPLLLIGAGFEHIFDGEFGGIILIFAALPIAAIGKVRLENALGFRPRLLKTGELRNRAFRMAATMETNLRKVFIVPQGKGHLLNAYAGGLGSISLTDTLSQSLSYAEVNCTIGHELAHLKLGHIRGYFRALFLPYVFLMILFWGWPERQPAIRPVLEFSALVVPSLILNFLSRLQEYAADREEVAFLRDPEASIRSLAKLHQISHVPQGWSYLSELFTSHPSLERRAKAIARAGNMPGARANEILEEIRIRERKRDIPELRNPRTGVGAKEDA